MKKVKSFLEEFKSFALKGNVLDLAIGVIIGSAFASITSSLVADIMMPLLGLFIRKDTFSSFVLHIGSATVNVGVFLETVINFIILAFIIFLLVKGINRLHRKKPKETQPPAPSQEVLLLTEIRDILADKHD